MKDRKNWYIGPRRRLTLAAVLEGGAGDSVLARGGRVDEVALEEEGL